MTKIEKIVINESSFDGKTMRKLVKCITSGNGLLSGFDIDQNERINNGDDFIVLTPGSFCSEGEVVVTNHSIKIDGIFSKTKDGDEIYFLHSYSDQRNTGIQVIFGNISGGFDLSTLNDFYRPEVFKLGASKLSFAACGPILPKTYSTVYLEIGNQDPEHAIGLSIIGPPQYIKGDKIGVTRLGYRKDGMFFRDPNIIFPFILQGLGDVSTSYDHEKETISKA